MYIPVYIKQQNFIWVKVIHPVSDFKAETETCNILNVCSGNMYNCSACVPGGGSISAISALQMTSFVMLLLDLN